MNSFKTWYFETYKQLYQDMKDQSRQGGNRTVVSQNDIVRVQLEEAIKENAELRSQVNILISERDQAIKFLRKTDKKLDQILDNLKK